MSHRPDDRRDRLPAHDRRHRGLVARRWMVALVALALLVAGSLSARAGVRGAGAADGPRIVRVEARAVAQPFVDEDAGGPAQVLDREITLDGSGFYGTSFGPFVHFTAADGTRVDAVMVVLESGGRIVAWPPAGLRGTFRVEVENPDGRKATATVGL